MRFQFGNFAVDVDARQLRRAGVAVHLSPKAFDLLITLIRERPRALAKADLHSRLWQDVFVSDASLAMVVAEVRAALGESARHPRHLRTIHRHGYAFQGVIEEIGDPGAVAGCWVVTASGAVSLAAGENLVGRDPKARVWLDSPSVSRNHAAIRVDGERVTVVDLGSKNGTRARNTRVIEPTPLADGDELRFGSVSARFRAGSSDPTRTDADA